MNPELLEQRIKEHIADADITIAGEGCNLSCVVVSEVFAEKSLLERQKMILALVNSEIKSGELHALTIKARTPAENK